MLKSLYIKNYAIIDELFIPFESKMTAITGETGAGKSILMGALALVLGDRADTQSLMNPEEKCIIEGIFEVSHNQAVLEYLEEHQLDAHAELCIRRELAPQGRSRVFINDTPSTLQVLLPLAHVLIDLHRQFDTLDLQSNDFQLALIDELAGNTDLLALYKKTYVQWEKAKVQLVELVRRNTAIRQELDYHQYLFQELENLNLQENELEQAEQELHKLSNSEAIKTNLNRIGTILTESENPMITQLKQVIQLTEMHHSELPEIKLVSERLHSLYIELKEIANDLNAMEESTFFDEERINQLAERLNEGNRLLKKHHVSSTQELLNIKLGLEEKIAAVHHAEEDEGALQATIDQLFEDLQKLAQQLSDSRHQQLTPLENNTNSLLKKVGMPNARIQIQHVRVDYNPFGMDKMDILFDANRSGKPQPIYKVASGGELSRLMLCIKSVLAKAKDMPTLIFDEIDTGISGETAVQVGNIMKELAEHHQLITITHLPQIAGKAHHHLFIYKDGGKKGMMTTKLKKLNDVERVDVLSEMLSGKNSSDQTKAIAKELMK